MPRIVIFATEDLTDVSDDNLAVTFDEAVSVGLLRDRHSQRQLVERLEWGAQDAERIQAIQPTPYTEVPRG